MKISKIILSIVAICGLVAFTGCQKDEDFITEHSYNWDDNTFYNTESDIIMGLNAAYATMEYLMAGNSHGQHSWMLQGMGLDTFTGTSGTAEWAANWPNIANGNGTTRHWYDNGYLLISRANTVIDMIDERGEKITWSNPTIKNELRGEAVLLRAWGYRCMAGMFGNVPIIEHRTTGAKYDYMPNTREEVWAFMKKDLEWAEKNLPKEPRLTGTVTAAAAGAYLAEVCLALGEFQAAKDAANRVINKEDGNYQIMTTRFGSRASEKTDRYGNSLAAPAGAYWDLFREGGNQDRESGNLEAIWTIQYNYGTFSTGGGGDSWYRTHAQCTESCWLPGLINGSQSTVTGLKSGKLIYKYGDNIACFAPGVDAGNKVDATGPESAFGRSQAKIARDSIGGKVDYEGQVCVPTRYMWETDNKSGMNLWKDTKDFRGSETMIQRNWYTPGGTRFFDEKKAMYERQAQGEYILTASDTMNAFVPRFWKFSDDKHPNFAVNGNKEYDQELYMLRMPEVYFLLAEACLALNDKPGAAAALNVVRSRANATPCTAADINIDYILDERSRELLGEEHRWITLNRLSVNPKCTYISDLYPTQDATTSNTLYERTRKYSRGFENDTANKREARTDGYEAFYSNITPHNYQFPIPTQVIDANTDAKYPQNPGY